MHRGRSDGSKRGRKGWAAGLALLLALALAAPAAAQGRMKVSIAFWGEEALAGWEATKAALEADLPQIELELVHIPDGRSFVERILVMGLGGEAPDLWVSNPDTAIQYWGAGLTTDLNRFIETDPTFRLDHFFPAALAAYSLRGVQVGFPTHFQVTGIWYNKNLFDRAGLVYPGGDWTWEDFREMALRLTVRPNPQASPTQWGTVLPMSAQYWMPWLFSSGGSVVDDLENPSRSTLASAESVQAFEFLKRLVADDQVVHPNWGRPDPFYQGVVGMYPYYAVSGRMALYTDFPYNVAEIPAGPAGAVNAIQPGGIVMGKPRFPEAAWEVIKWLAVRASTNTIPAYIPLVTSPEWPVDPVPADYNRQAWIRGAQNALPQTINHPRMADIYGAVDGMRDAIQGMVDVRTQAQTIAERINGLLAEE